MMLPGLLSLRKLLFAVAGCCFAVIAALGAGPVSSGAVFLLLPGHHQQPTDHDLPQGYTPLHKGHVSLDVGVYIRMNDDLIVRGTPPLVLRRTYISGFRADKEFGIGTTQAADFYVIGDGKLFQWVALIRPGDSRITFERTSAGTTVFNAMFQHRASAGEWQGARLGWTGINWALRRRDGSLFTFRSCGPDDTSVCGIVRHRDADGHVIDYRRDAAGRLLKMEAARDRWIAFEYDDHHRIARAHDSTQREVRYEYDARGRLVRARSNDGIEHRYTYTERDEMATILEPGTDIENTYDANGRCIRQVNRYADGSEPFVFDFTYTLDGSDVVQTDARRSDGTWIQYAFAKSGVTKSETWGGTGGETAAFTYERDATTNAAVSLTLTCPDRSGRQLRHASLVKPGHEEWIKWDLVRTHCSWSGRWRAAE
jgi:YD repeat-containing protein